MKPTRYLTDEELIARGLEALLTALWPVEATRFLSLRRAGRIESVRRHRKWQETLDKKQFFDQVFGPEA